MSCPSRNGSPKLTTARQPRHGIHEKEVRNHPPSTGIWRRGRKRQAERGRRCLDGKTERPGGRWRKKQRRPGSNVSSLSSPGHHLSAVSAEAGSVHQCLPAAAMFNEPGRRKEPVVCPLAAGEEGRSGRQRKSSAAVSPAMSCPAASHVHPVSPAAVCCCCPV